MSSTWGKLRPGQPSRATGSLHGFMPSRGAVTKMTYPNRGSMLKPSSSIIARRWLKLKKPRMPVQFLVTPFYSEAAPLARKDSIENCATGDGSRASASARPSLSLSLTRSNAASGRPGSGSRGSDGSPSPTSTIPPMPPPPAPSRPGRRRRNGARRSQAQSRSVTTPSPAAIGRSKKRQQVAVRLDHRGHEVAARACRPSTMPRIAGATGKPFSSIRKPSTPNDQHDADAEDRVVDGEGADDAEQQDDRHQHLARHVAGCCASSLIADQPSGISMQVGEEEGDEHRVDELRVAASMIVGPGFMPFM